MLTRRAFVAGSAVPAAMRRRASAQVTGPRNLLTSRWNLGKVSAGLLPRERYQPFRDGWDTLPQDARGALIASGERALKGTWEVLPASMALEFARNGNRSRYEALRNRRRMRLQELVMAERLEGKGRFTDETANGVWLTCEETFWGVPAHLGAQKAGVGLPDVTEPIVDLFAAETAGLLAWTLYLLEGALRAVSPLIPERIRLETDRRVLTPAQTRDFSWMGFAGHSVNNWDPWICSNWLTAVLLVEREEQRRAAAVYRILRCLDNFLNSYADDGGCDEGPSYWGRAGASLFDCLELLHQASGGALNGFDLPLVHQIGLYICRAHIAGEWYTNFSDAPARVFTNGDLVYRFGKRLDDDVMKKHGGFAAFLRDEHALPGDSIGRQLPALFNLAELRQAPRAQALLRDAWMPGIGVMAARRQEGSTQGLYLAAEAGNNGKSHNHNDVGNFVVYANGRPAIIDVGVETYTAKTFSPQRYEIWAMQSAFHNCPTIDGAMQSAGRRFCATDVSYRAGDQDAELRSNLATAYPPEAKLQRWIRSVRLDRGRGEIEVVDDYALAGPARIITLTLMTPCLVQRPAPGKLSLEGTLQIAYDAVLSPAIEEIKLQDGQLRSVWGEKLYRILLRAENPPLRGKWTLKISLAA